MAVDFAEFSFLHILVAGTSLNAMHFRVGDYVDVQAKTYVRFVIVQNLAHGVYRWSSPIVERCCLAAVISWSLIAQFYWPFLLDTHFSLGSSACHIFCRKTPDRHSAVCICSVLQLYHILLLNQKFCRSSHPVNSFFVAEVMSSQTRLQSAE